jgi:hypothetical protein
MIVVVAPELTGTDCHAAMYIYIGWARTIYSYVYTVWCAYGILSREITIHMVIYGVCILFWPTLYIQQFMCISIVQLALVISCTSEFLGVVLPTVRSFTGKHALVCTFHKEQSSCVHCMLLCALSTRTLCTYTHA